MGDGVGLVARDAVGDVDVLAVAGDGDLARSSGASVGGREGGAKGAQLLGVGETDAGAVVGDLEDLDLVGQLAENHVVGCLLGLGGVPGAVTGAAAGGDTVAVGDDEGIVLGVNDQDAVTTEVVDGEEATGGVENGLVGTVLILALRVGADRISRVELLEELQIGARRDVPDVNGALAAVKLLACVSGGGRVLVVRLTRRRRRGASGRQ